MICIDCIISKECNAPCIFIIDFVKKSKKQIWSINKTLKCIFCEVKLKRVQNYPHSFKCPNCKILYYFLLDRIFLIIEGQKYNLFFIFNYPSFPNGKITLGKNYNSESGKLDFSLPQYEI